MCTYAGDVHVEVRGQLRGGAVDPKDGTQVIRLGVGTFYSEPSCWPLTLLLNSTAAISTISPFKTREKEPGLLSTRGHSSEIPAVSLRLNCASNLMCWRLGLQRGSLMEVGGGFLNVTGEAALLTVML